MNGTLKLLVVDHDPATLDSIAGAMAPDGLRLLGANDAEAALETMAREQPHMVLLDPGAAGMDLVDRLLEFDPGLTLLVISAQPSVEMAVEAIRRGAFGAPAMFVGETLFWGNDRIPLLEQFVAGGL